MGVLAFIAVSLLLLKQSNLPEIDRQVVEFQWVGAPDYVKPVYIRCFQDEIVFYDLFQGKDFRLSFQALLAEIQLNNGPLSRYLRRVVSENQRIKRFIRIHGTLSLAVDLSGWRHYCGNSHAAHRAN